MPTIARRSASRRWSCPVSLCMEALQSYPPYRVPSNVDSRQRAGRVGCAVIAGAWSWWAPSTAGPASPALFSTRRAAPWCCWRCGRSHCCSRPPCRGPGQVFERLETALPTGCWNPVPRVAAGARDRTAAVDAGTEMLCVALGALIPCLLGYSVIRFSAGARSSPSDRRRRHPGDGALGRLELGPGHAWPGSASRSNSGSRSAWRWHWLAAVTARGCAAVLLLALVVHLSMLNQAPESAYFAQTLQDLGTGASSASTVCPVLGWLWPYAALSMC